VPPEVHRLSVCSLFGGGEVADGNSISAKLIRSALRKNGTDQALPLPMATEVVKVVIYDIRPGLRHSKRGIVSGHQCTLDEEDNEAKLHIVFLLERIAIFFAEAMMALISISLNVVSRAAVVGPGRAFGGPSGASGSSGQFLLAIAEGAAWPLVTGEPGLWAIGAFCSLIDVTQNVFFEEPSAGDQSLQLVRRGGHVLREPR